MASKSTMKIQFPRGGIIPKEVLNAKVDKKCEPGEAVSVPKAYGEHVVSDRFAEKVTASVKGRNPDADNKKVELAKLEVAVTEARAALDKAETDEAKAAAQASLDDAEAALAAAKA